MQGCILRGDDFDASNRKLKFCKNYLLKLSGGIPGGFFDFQGSYPTETDDAPIRDKYKIVLLTHDMEILKTRVDEEKALKEKNQANMVHGRLLVFQVE